MINPEAAGPTLVVGLGCQRDCSAGQLLELIEHSLHGTDFCLADVSALASIDLKAHEPGLLQLAAQLDRPLKCFSATQLAIYETQLSHRSPVAFQHSGCYGVAESAALALASESGPAQLRITRQKSARATFALAISPSFDR
ncbi:cobalamin biosynthesis protein [Pseudomonas caspiana]